MFAVVTTRTGLAAFYELVQRAGSSMSSHRYREAVIDYATAGEIFITEMYREIAPRRAVPRGQARQHPGRPVSRSRAPPVASARPRRRAHRPALHRLPLVAPLLSAANPIVQGGRDSIPPRAETARIGLVKMVVDVRESLRATTGLEDLAANIQWAHLVGGLLSLSPPAQVRLDVCGFRHSSR
jgi:hypothetical protein